MPRFAGYQQVDDDVRLVDEERRSIDNDEREVINIDYVSNNVNDVVMNNGYDGQQVFINLRLGNSAELMPGNSVEIQPIGERELQGHDLLSTACDQAMYGVARNFLVLQQRRWKRCRRWYGGGQYRRWSTAILRKAEKVKHVDTGDGRCLRPFLG